MITLVDTTTGNTVAVGNPIPLVVELAYQKMLDAWCAYMDACDLNELDPHAVSHNQLRALVHKAKAADAEFYAVQAMYFKSLGDCTCDPRTELSCPSCCARHALTGDEMPY